MSHKRLPTEAVNNMLNAAKELCPELKDFQLSFAPKSQGEKVALMKSHYLKTDYMLTREMNQFLRGYMFKAQNKF